MTNTTTATNYGRTMTTRPPFSRRAGALKSSFIRDILKVANDPGVISFAGGLPKADLFPLPALAEAAAAVFREQGNAVLQYSETPGEPALREWIAERYRRHHGLAVDAAQVMITNGSQQALDLLGKVLIDEGDGVLIEEPGYLGAIQAFSLYQPRFLPVAMTATGIDTAALAQRITSETHAPKLLYTVPEFQNPSGISYDAATRNEVAAQLRGSSTIVVEDNPYGELRYRGTPTASFLDLLPEQTVLLGSFSKTVAPAMRLGWLVAKGALMEKLLIAKQAADLHSNALAQRVMAHFLRHNDIDTHLSCLRDHYRSQQAAMSDAIATHFPAGVHVTRPEGGMFLWATLPEGVDAMALFEQAIAAGVAFVPGEAFHLEGRGRNTLRLNFTHGDEGQISEGVRRLGIVLKEALQ